VKRDAAVLTLALAVAVYAALYAAARVTHVMVYREQLCGPSGVIASAELGEAARAVVDLAFALPRDLENLLRYFWP